MSGSWINRAITLLLTLTRATEEGSSCFLEKVNWKWAAQFSSGGRAEWSRTYMVNLRPSALCSALLPGWNCQGYSPSHPRVTMEDSSLENLNGPRWHTWKNVSQVIIKTPAHPCLLQHYLQYLSYGNSQDDLQLMNGLRKCDIYTQWNFIQPQRRMKFCHMQVNGWNENIILSEVSQAQKTKGLMFSLICRPNTNIAILWKTGHTKGRSLMGQRG
jgi:hypothetical protein